MGSGSTDASSVPPRLTGSAAHTPSWSRSRLRAEWLAVFAIVLLIVSVWVHATDLSAPGAADRSGRLKGGDYATFYAAGRLALQGRWLDLYAPEAQLAVLHTRVSPALQSAPPPLSYSPAVALAVAPLATLPFLRSYAVFVILSVCAFATGLRFLLLGCRHLRQHRSVVVLCAAAFPGLTIALRSGQFACFWWLAFCALVAMHSRAIAGVGLGVLWLKPTLAPLATGILVWKHHWSALGGMAFVAALHLTVVGFVTGLEPVQAYLAELWRLVWHPASIEPFPASAHSLFGFGRLAWPSELQFWFGVGASIAAVWITLDLWRTDTDDRLRWAAVVLCTLLISPHVMTYDLLLAGMPIVLITDWLLGRAPRHSDDGLILLMTGTYLASFSPLLAEATGVQLSTVFIAGLLVALRSAARTRPSAQV